MKIVLLEDLGVSPEKTAEQKEKLAAMGHTLKVCTRAQSLPELKKQAADADVLILANMPLPEAAIQDNPNLKLIDVAFTGVDHIPMELANQKGIMVCNASGYATEAVAELSLAMMIDRLRQVGELERLCKNGMAKGTIRGSLLKGKTVGIVGAGAIGREVARLCKAFNARVIGCQRHPIEDPNFDAQCSLPELLAQSDIVSVHVPLTNKTRNLIGARELAQMKPTAILINTARGPVVNAKDLSNALKEGRIAGAALDVFDKEPPLNKDLAILHAPHITVTPHVGYDTVESMEKRFDIVFDNLYSWLEGNPKNQVN